MSNPHDRTNTALLDGVANQRTTSAFGTPRPNGTKHQGRDSASSQDSPFWAAGYGTVMGISKNDPVYGYKITVRYPMKDGRVVQVMYGHLNRIDVVLFQTVDVNTRLGLTGGRPGHPGAGISTWDHLHESMWVNGILGNPDALLTNRTVAGSGGTATPGGLNPTSPEEDEMPNIEYIAGTVDGVPSWAWLNWSNGKVWSCHTQADANWVAGYMQSFTGPGTVVTGEQYKSKLAMLGLLNPQAANPVDASALAAALAPQLAAAIVPLLGDLDGLNEEQIADKIALKLAPEFERINDNIDDQPTEFVITPKE